MESMQRCWIKVFKRLFSYDIKTLVKSKKGLAEKMRNTSTKGPMQMTMLENVGVLGGSLGKCLA